MWIVLLDHSGSMGEPFEAIDIEALGRVRSVEADVKLDAAKKSFLIELRRLPESMQVILFGFTSKVTEVHSGPASDVAQFERQLSRLRPVNGTNIAAALTHVINYAHHKPQVLLISDGKSDLAAAKTAAHRCANAEIRVDMLVIDPTDEGLEMAKAIAGITHGRWDPVTSADELAKRTSEAGATVSRDLARAEELLHQADDEYHAIQTQVEPQARVSFSAGYPAEIEPQRKYPLLVYIHLNELKQAIEALLKEEIGASGAPPICSSAAAATRIPRGTLITVQPNIPGIFANPPRQEIVWLEDYHKLNFEIQHAGPDAAGRSCAGFIDVLADGAFVGHIPVSIAVVTDSLPLTETVPLTVTSNPFARIFASYAHEDEAVVQACKETYKAFGIHLYVDRDDLLSGQPWRQTLQKLIAKCDLFQLYWSQPAADSTEVASEWELALVVDETQPCDFIRPLYWRKPMPDPPAKLGHLHFAYLDIERLRVAPKQVQIDEEESNLPSSQISDAIFPVISLTSDDDQQSIATIQKSIGRAVAFLEHVTGLRYYPPPTLLVDEYVVTAVRSYLTVDKDGDKEPQDDEIGFALEILQSMALAFHVHQLEPKGLDDEDQVKGFYHLNTELEWNDLLHVRNLCEYIFAHPVKSYLKGMDPFEQPSRDSVEDLHKRAQDTFWLRREVKHICAVATESDREKIRQVLGEEGFINLLDGQTDLSRLEVSEYAERVRSKSYLAVSEKYRTAFFDLFHDCETTFCRSANFCDYLDEWFEHWMRYLDVIGSQYNVVVKITYAVSRPALDWLKRRYPNVHFKILSEGENWCNRQEPPVCTWAIFIGDIRQVICLLRPIVMDAVRSPASVQHEVRKYFVATAPTYGIFASAVSERATRYLLELARDRNWPTGIALAGCHKVLLCANAFERYKSALLDLELDPQQADQLAEWFLTATLVHEHFHAVLATGTDKQGNISWAANNWEEWQKGYALNESLAAWVERHFFRDNGTMFAHITEYINSGSYPGWPYLGAEEIEEIYKQNGLPGVRALILRLREDPQFAQEMFDELR